MGKIKSSDKKRRSFAKIVIISIVAIFCVIILLAISFGKPEIIFFSLFFGFLFFFMAIAIKMLHSRLKFLRSTNAYAEKFLNSSEEVEQQGQNQRSIANPMYFHIFMVVIILVNLILSYFNIGDYNESFYDQFYNDLVFQFNVAILFTIIGFLNPLLTIPQALVTQIEISNSQLYNFISNKKMLFNIRLISCLLVIALFIYNGWLVFPNFMQENLMLLGIDLALVIFLITTMFRMIKYAKIFLVENVFRVVKSFTIFTSALFILVPLAPLTMLSVHLLGMDEKSFNFMPTPLIGFIVIMIYVEYTLNVKKKGEKIESALTEKNVVSIPS